MPLSFLIPLAIALPLALLSYQSREEIVSTFSAIVAFISLVVSFILAPWMVQIGILLLGLGGIRYFCHRHSCQETVRR